MSGDLVAWLRDVHEQAEHTAQAATPGPWVVDEEDMIIAPEHLKVQVVARYRDPGPGTPAIVVAGEMGPGADPEDLAHIVMHHPGAVLAGVEAERLLLSRHEPKEWEDLNEDTWEMVTKLYCRTCAVGESCHCCLDREDKVWPCPVWRTVAWGWRHMPGWQDHWAPEETS